jgi:hypothetical protein
MREIILKLLIYTRKKSAIVETLLIKKGGVHLTMGYFDNHDNEFLNEKGFNYHFFCAHGAYLFIYV